MQVNGTESRMYRVKQVAELLDVHVSTVYRLVESERLHAVRIGFGKGAVRVPAESLDTYLKSLGMDPNELATGEAIA
ncbi:helix-turn-helix domain-containing protein [Actinopolyspora mortivallis]|uniref:DNA-binding protein n=1 Tax=Actinopolyspora mortivallis TaxID=33906 RepID=A0A2T0GSV6_ACTMO|nr:helix-turn-helix domain-containing protein [Actinopolyspora mortivallis]PRW62123.1 DNA-binding protein [Actinopolyspora mortivallis]